ncbi:MAG: hypothetical protein R3D98_00560 [Candidatus Krumholzibacteriia bacterium]
MSATVVGDDVRTVADGLPVSPRQLELDAEAGRIYWSGAGGSGCEVGSMALDGTDVRTHVSNLGYGYGLALEMGAAVPVAQLPRPGVDLQCYPNPFNPRTTFLLELPAAAPVRLQILGLDGSLLGVLVDDWREAGRHAETWDGTAGGRALPRACIWGG